MDAASYRNRCNPVADGGTVTGRPRAAMPGYAGFAERYREASFRIMPDPDDCLAKWAPFGYDAAGVIMAAARQAAEGGEVTRESVAVDMEIFRRQPYQGVTGVIQFDEYGGLQGMAGVPPSASVEHGDQPGIDRVGLARIHHSLPFRG